MPFYKLTTSAYDHNCALNAGTPEIVSRLLSLSESELTEADSSPLFGWKKAFIARWNLPAGTSLLDIQQIFKHRYQNPQDQQILMGPALRLMLKELIETNAEVKKELFYDMNVGLLATLKNYLRIGADVHELSKKSLFYRGCGEMFNQILVVYQEFCDNRKLTAQQIASPQWVEAFLNKNNTYLGKPCKNVAIIEAKWNSVHTKKLASLIGDSTYFLESYEAGFVFRELGGSTKEYQSHRLLDEVSPTVEIKPHKIIIDIHPVVNPLFTVHMNMEHIANTKGKIVSFANHWETLATNFEYAKEHNESFDVGSRLKDFCLLSPKNAANNAITKHVQASLRLNKNTDVMGRPAWLTEALKLATAQKNYIRALARNDANAIETTRQALETLGATAAQIETLESTPLPNETESGVNKVKYTYKDKNNLVHFFFTDKVTQEVCDERLAIAIANKEVDFLDLPGSLPIHHGFWTSGNAREQERIQRQCRQEEREAKHEATYTPPRISSY